MDVLTRCLIRQKVIRKEEAEMFQYSLATVIHSIAIQISVFFIGFCARQIDQTIVFLCFYPILRKFSGGVHEISRWRCFVSTLIFFLIFLGVCKTANIYLIACGSIIAGLYIIQNAPIEHFKKPLNLRQKEIYHGMICKNIIVLNSVSIVGLMLKKRQIYSAIFVLIIMNGVNLIMLKFNHEKIKTYRWHVLRAITSLVLFIGASNIRGTCDGWHYQPEITANMRKYMDE